MKRYARFLLLVSLGLVACRPAVPLPTPAALAVAPTLIPPTPTLAATETVAPTATTAGPTMSAATVDPPTPTPVGAGLKPTPTIATPLPPPTPLITPICPPGRIEHGTVESGVAGGPMAYRIYLPPCYGLDGRVYPTLYLFGGNIHDDAIWDSLGLDEAAEAAISVGAIPPLLIVMPDNGWLANTTTSGPASYEGFALNELIPHIEAHYCAWPAAEGRAVGGLSRGGYWSLMMAFRRPDLFRSVAAHSPALIDSHAGPAEDPRLTAANDLGGLRIYVDIGARDPYLKDAQPLHDALTAAGVAHAWLVNEGNHEEAYWRAHLLDYLTWYTDGLPTDRAALPVCAVAP